jgi:hypothetical protein
MLVEQTKNTLKRFTPEYDICFWDFSEDQKFNHHLELVNYLTDLSIGESELAQKSCHYIFYKNFGRNKLFVLFKKIDDINLSYLDNSIVMIEDQKRQYLGLNTQKVEEKLSSYLNTKSFVSIN